MAKKRPTPPAETPREPKLKKRKALFKIGDFVQNVEDASLIVIVTKDVEKGTSAFHGTCISSTKRQVGEHERFWLIDRFTQVNVTVQVN